MRDRQAVQRADRLTGREPRVGGVAGSVAFELDPDAPADRDQVCAGTARSFYGIAASRLADVPA